MNKWKDLSIEQKVERLHLQRKYYGDSGLYGYAISFLIGATVMVSVLSQTPNMQFQLARSLFNIGLWLFAGAIIISASFILLYQYKIKKGDC